MRNIAMKGLFVFTLCLGLAAQEATGNSEEGLDTRQEQIQQPSHSWNLQWPLTSGAVFIGPVSMGLNIGMNLITWTYGRHIFSWFMGYQILVLFGHGPYLGMIWNPVWGLEISSYLVWTMAPNPANHSEVRYTVGLGWSFGGLSIAITYNPFTHIFIGRDIWLPGEHNPDWRWGLVIAAIHG